MKEQMKKVAALVLVLTLCFSDLCTERVFARSISEAGQAQSEVQNGSQAEIQPDVPGEAQSVGENAGQKSGGISQQAGSENSTGQETEQTGTESEKEVQQSTQAEKDSLEENATEEVAKEEQYYVNLTGICYIENRNGIDVGVAYDSNDPSVKFRWKIYNLDTYVWTDLTDWNGGNWATWHPEAGNYWIHVEARTSDGNISQYTIAFAAQRSFTDNYMAFNGICYIVRNDKVDVGVNYDAADPNIQFQWKSYNLDTGIWTKITDWTGGNWMSWKPTPGNYWVYVEAKNVLGSTINTAMCYYVDKDYANGYVDVKGIYATNSGRTLSLGASYDSSDSAVQFKWEMYNVALNNWTTLSDWSKSSCIDWKPASGNYWINVTAKTGTGQTSSFCQGFSLNFGEVKSKKGLQGNYGIYSDPDLNVTHVLENTHLGAWLANRPTENCFIYNGTSYYFNRNPRLDDEVRKANSRGITVSLVLLMPWSDAHVNMIIPCARDGGAHTYYGLNAGDEQLQALFCYLAQHYGQPDCHIDNWILGNEVNMPTQYNYTGSLDVTSNAAIYADSFCVLYNALHNLNPYGKAYISLDHSWTHDDEGRGIAGVNYLYAFFYAMNSRAPGANWNIAYHLYTPIMTSSRMWLKKYKHYTPQSEHAEFISPVNLDVLTNFVATHFGSQTRIILSEQGYDCKEGNQYQAAALAYAFYQAQFNNMVDAAIFRTYQPDVNDGIFDFGLKDGNGNPREAYNVFKAMDTPNGTAVTNAYLPVIGISSWDQVITNYQSNVMWDN